MYITFHVKTQILLQVTIRAERTQVMHVTILKIEEERERKRESERDRDRDLYNNKLQVNIQIQMQKLSK